MSTKKTPTLGRTGVAARPLDKPPAAQEGSHGGTRRRSNSQSQVILGPLFLGQDNSVAGQDTRASFSALKAKPLRRNQAEFYVTLVSLNDTFATKHIHVPYYPETCKLGRPTGTKVKPHVSNGYFDSRVLSRNHACMYVNGKLGQIMVQDMGSSNGTFVNLEKLAGEPVAVNIGDTINLGFNIQVETNHKQISARVENISVVSNNPKGAILTMFPRLTKLVMASFSEADMRHYEFIQNLFAQSTRDALAETSAANIDAGVGMGLASQTDPKRQALRAFEQGMFSDIVPSLDKVFESSADLRTQDVGLFKNSGIHPAPELLSTLDYLGANLAKVKQQNATLTSLEVFFSKYTKSVDEINALYVKSQVAKHAAEHEAKHRLELDKMARLLQEQEAKISAQSRLVSSLESELAALRLDHKRLLEQSREATRDESKGVANTGDGENLLENDFVFTPNGSRHDFLNDLNNEFSHGSRRDSRSAPSVSSSSSDEETSPTHELGRVLQKPLQEKTTTRPPMKPTVKMRIPGSISESISGPFSDTISGLISEEAAPGEPSHSSVGRALLLQKSLQQTTNERETEESNRQTLIETTPHAKSTSRNQIVPFSPLLHHVMAKYKTHGVAVGLVVLVAGFIYQNSK